MSCQRQREVSGYFSWECVGVVPGMLGVCPENGLCGRIVCGELFAPG